MLDIKMTVTGKKPIDIINDIHRITKTLMDDTAKAGQATLEWINVIIDARKKRSSSHHMDTISLGDAIERSSDFIYSADSVFVGIGKIDKLNVLNQAWSFLNYGVTQTGETIPGDGKFVPGYWEGDKFMYSPMCGTGMVVKTPIFGLQNGQPLNYIQEGGNFMHHQIKSIIAKAQIK